MLLKLKFPTEILYTLTKFYYRVLFSPDKKRSEEMELGSLSEENLFLRFIYPSDVPNRAVCVLDILIHTILSPVKWIFILIGAIVYFVAEVIFKSLKIMFWDNEFPKFRLEKKPSYKTSRRLIEQIFAYEVVGLGSRKSFEIVSTPMLPLLFWILMAYGPGQLIVEAILVSAIASNDTAPGDMLISGKYINWELLFYTFSSVYVFGLLYGSTKIGNWLEPIILKLCPTIDIK